LNEEQWHFIAQFFFKNRRKLIGKLPANFISGTATLADAKRRQTSTARVAAARTR
jgi:hypothetical protein